MTPRFLIEYAANRTYALTNRVEDVADLLGLVSLDAARTRIDRDWQRNFAAVIREQGGTSSDERHRTGGA